MKGPTVKKEPKETLKHPQRPREKSKVKKEHNEKKSVTRLRLRKPAP